MRTYEFRGANGKVCCSSDNVRYLCDVCKAKAQPRVAMIRSSGDPQRPILFDQNGIADGYATALGRPLPTVEEIEWPVVEIEENPAPDPYAPELARRREKGETR